MQSLDKTIKRVALINDMSCFGKCSLTVSVPIISAFGCETVALPTALLSTHTGEFRNYTKLDLTSEMEKIISHWEELGLGFDCIYTGYFCSVEQIDLTIDFIKRLGDKNTLVIVDPVMGDNGSLYEGFTEEFAEKMRELTRFADVITPNLTEAAILAGLPFTESPEKIADALTTPNIAITGVREKDEIGYLIKTETEAFRVMAPLLDCPLHGSGDVFTSALCGELMNKTDFLASARAAAEFCDECIRDTAPLQPRHWYGIMFEEAMKRRHKPW